MTGKSTLGHLVAEKLGRKHIRLDELRWEYYKEIGYDEALAARIRVEEGAFGLHRYWEPFHAHAVERILSNFPNDCVIDFGGGHSVYEDESLLMRVQQALAPFANVVLILPSPDKVESIQILRQRFEQESARFYKFMEILTTHHSNADLAKITVYTNDKNPQQISEEILSKINGNSPK
jgi:shikimate kinase